MFHSLQSQIAFGALLAACCFAFGKGGAAERGGAVLICLSWLSEYAISFVLKNVLSTNSQELILLATDAALAIGLLLLAFRYAKVWLGVAMLMLSGELALHGAVMGDWGMPFLEYIMLNNFLSFGLVLLLAGATATAWFQRTHKARSAAISNEGASGSTLNTGSPAV